MELIIEFFLELYMELMMFVVPENTSNKKIKVLATILALTVLAGVFALVIWGLVLIIDKNNLLGIIPLAFAIIISIIQITLGIIINFFIQFFDYWKDISNII